MEHTAAAIYGDYRRAATAITAQLNQDADGLSDVIDEAAAHDRSRDLVHALVGAWMLVMPNDTAATMQGLGKLWEQRERDAAQPAAAPQPPQRERSEYPDTVTVVPRNVDVVFDSDGNNGVSVQLLAECPPPIGSLRLALKPGQSGVLHAALSTFVNLTDDQFDRLAALVARNSKGEPK